MNARLKPALRVFDLRNHGNRIQIGFRAPLAVTVEEPSEELVKLLYLLDGKHTNAEIANLINREEHDVYDVVSQLIDLGVVQSPSQDENTLTPTEKAYYNRQLNYWTIYPETYNDDPLALQQSLKDATLTIVGIGGGGTHVAETAARAGIGHLRLIDFDCVDLSNIARQWLYEPEDVGKPKIRVAVEKLRRVNPNIKVEGIEMRIDSLEDARAVLGGSNFVVLAADSPPVLLQNWVNQACVEHGISFGTLGVSQHVLLAGPIVIPRITACLACIDTQENQRNPVRPDILQALSSYAFPWNEAVCIPLLPLGAAMLGFELCRFLTTGRTALGGNVMVIAPVDWTISRENWARSKECPVCSGNGEKTT